MKYGIAILVIAVYISMDENRIDEFNLTQMSPVVKWSLVQSRHTMSSVYQSLMNEYNHT